VQALLSQLENNRNKGVKIVKIRGRKIIKIGGENSRG